MSGIVIIDALILVVLLVIGVPVPFCFSAAVIFLVIAGDYPSATFLIPAGYGKISSIVILAIPLYILAGGIMSQGGIAVRLVDLADSIFGRVRGGMGVVVIVATAIFGAISGMASSAVAAIGTIMIPRMVELGYDRAYAASLVANSSVLALMIPPSAAMILYGWVTGTSILACFLAPVVPAFILIGLFSFWNFVLTRNMPLKTPEKTSFKLAFREVRVQGRRGALGLAMPLIILGCIYGGVTTPTEAAAIAVVYAIPICLFVYKDLNFKSLYEVIWKTGQTTGVLMVLIFFAAMLARLFTMEDVPQGILETFVTLTENKILLLLMVNLFLLLIGMFMEDVSGILLAAPMLMPIMVTLDIHPVHFAAIVSTNLGMGLITPPTAPILYFGALIGNVALPKMLKPTLVFVVFGYLPVVLLTTFIPALSLTLPRLVLGIE